MNSNRKGSKPSQSTSIGNFLWVYKTQVFLKESGFIFHLVFPIRKNPYIKVYCKPFSSQPLIIFSPEPHQGTAAEQNHEDDEGLKPIVFYDEEAGFPQNPPRLA